MARGKKKEAVLSPAERLQAALVPESEQPYKVPENWCWCFLGKLVLIRRGASPRPIKLYVTANENGVNWIKIGDADGDKYITHVNERITETGAKKSVFVEKRTLLLSNSMSFGHPYILKVDGCIHDGWLALTPSEATKKEYLYYALLSSEWYFQQVAVGTAVRNLNSERVAGTPIPIPPLSEQHRIIERIESLFAKLDEAKQKAQDALDSFETRKAAILHKAFNGELTAQWRKEHGVGMESWKKSTVGQVCCDVKVGIVIKPSQYYTDKEKGTPAFRSANVRENHIDNFDWVYLNHVGMENNSRSVVHTGDVLVVRSGNPGTACVVSEKFDGYNAIDILIAVPDHKQISSEFLCNYTNSPFGKTLIFENKRGMALAHFNVKGYSELPISVPQLDEQTEIVHILDDLLAKERQAKEAAEKVLEQIDLTKKAILARAFRGELGTNNPSEESAVGLVEKIIAHREDQDAY